MSVGEYIQLAAFNALHDLERPKAELLDLAHFVGLGYREEQTPDDVVVWFSWESEGIVHEVDLPFSRPRNDGSFHWDGENFYETRNGRRR